MASFGAFYCLLTVVVFVQHFSRSNAGSTFVRWGRAADCPGQSTLIYSGLAAGGHVDDTGAAANKLCLVTAPIFDDANLTTEYGRITGGHLAEKTNIRVPCSFCYTEFSTTFMIPGTNKCPKSTTEQYHGYLSSGNRLSMAASEFVCLDSNTQGYPGITSSLSTTYTLFERVQIECGTLLCPSNSTGKAALCAVCSIGESKAANKGASLMYNLSMYFWIPLFLHYFL